jgi:adenylosuccinate lyase
VNRILHNLCTDLWTYISMGYISQIPQAGATGSSTMPHKINPIRFENA